MIPPTYVSWTHEGKEYRQVDAAYKRALMREYAKKYKPKTFIETGTYMGDTVGDMRNYCQHVYSIETSGEYYERAINRFKDCPEVRIILGNSAVELPRLLFEVLLESIPQPILFWLDAHGENWIGPLEQEMSAIFNSGIKGVVLADDMDYIPDPGITHPNWRQTIEHGILRAVHVG